jgi:hypothetical protein
MQRIHIRDYGIDIVFGGPMGLAEAKELIAEMTAKLPQFPSPFGCLVDSRQARAYTAEAREIFKRCIFMLREHGMERVAVVSDSAIAALQAKRLGKETDTLLWSRYISTATHPDWQRIVRDWLLFSIDPDQPKS